MQNDNDLNNRDYTDIYSALENFADHEPRHVAPPDRKPSESSGTATARKPVRKKKRKTSRAPIVAAILVLLFGSVVVAAMSGMFFPPAETVDTQSTASVDESSLLIEELSEESEEESSSLSYEPTGEFKTDNSRLTPAVVKKLEKDVTAKYIVLYDATADSIIYQRNGNKKCYPASTTKMMTGIVGAKIIPPETIITVGDEIEMIEWDSSTAGLMKGMKMTFETLMDALMLPSGNDAAYTIAVNAARMYTGNEKLSNAEAVKVFMNLVNEAAKEIGCKNTHYVTPDGWHDDNHYTNAADLAKIAAYARTIPLVKASCGKEEVVWDLIKDESEVSEESSTQQSSAPAVGSSASVSDVSPAESSTENTSSQETDQSDSSDDEEESEVIPIPDSMYWYNSNRILQVGSESYSEYCDGMKTGFTDEAGTSVVASATMDGHTFIAVVMFGETLYKKYEDANILFKEGFKLYGLNYKYGADYNE